MVTILRQGELVLYSHTAWAEDADGGGFSLTESEDALYIGSYIDSLEAESEDPEKYTWTPLSETGETDESAYDDVIGEMMDSMENMEGDIITASEIIEGTQNTSDIGLETSTSWWERTTAPKGGQDQTDWFLRLSPGPSISRQMIRSAIFPSPVWKRETIISHSRQNS